MRTILSLDRNRAVLRDGLIFLSDLISWRKVMIKVVLPVEARREVGLAVEGERCEKRKFEGFRIELLRDPSVQLSDS